MFLGRVVKPGEPLWLPDDRAWALALHDLEADRCQGCGQPLSDTLHPDAMGRYTVDEVGGCAGCQVLRHKASDAEPHTQFRVRPLTAEELARRG